MRYVAFAIGAVSVFTIIGQAAAAPIPMTWDYEATVETYALASAKNTSSSESDDLAAHNTAVSVTSFATAFSPQNNQQDSTMTASVGGTSDADGAAIAALMSFVGAGTGNSSGEGQATAAFSGSLLIGNSAGVAPGTEATLTVSASVLRNVGGWAGASWSLNIYDQAGGTLLATVNAADPEATLTVTTNSSLYANFTLTGSTGSQKNADMGYEVKINLSSIAVPEPATMGLILMGGLCAAGWHAAKRRRAS